MEWALRLKEPRSARAIALAVGCALISASSFATEVDEGTAGVAAEAVAEAAGEAAAGEAAADEAGGDAAEAVEQATGEAAAEEAGNDAAEAEAGGGEPPAEPAGEASSADLDMDDEAILFEEIPSVYGVSRFEQKITEAPSFVTLITSDEISKHGYRTLAQALRGVTGLFVTNDRNYSYLGFRGFNRPGDFNSRVLLLVDGHRMNDNLYDQAGLGMEAVVDVDLIDRIEVIRGPSSSLYGTNAFFGVINVITKRGRDLRGSELSASVGSFDTYRGRGTYGNKFGNGIELLMSSSYFNSGGQEYLYYPEFDDPATNNGITRNADGESLPSTFGKLSFRDVTLQGGFVSREKEIPTAKYGTFFPTDETRSTDEHGYLFLKYERQLDSKLNLFGRIYYDHFDYRGDYLYDVSGGGPPDLVLNRDKSTGDWWGFESKIDRPFFDSHNVSAGVEFRHNFRQDLWNADTDPTIVYLDDQRNSWNTAVFVQDEYAILENLILNAGVRYDYYDSFGSTVNPRVALVYNWEKTTFKALYGTAFRGPNAYERYYVGTGFKANPDLKPETIATYELVVEHALTPYMRATASGYYYTIDDLVSQQLDTSDGLLFFENGEEVEAKGLELQLEMDERGPLGIAGRLGYALQLAENRKTNKRLTNSPAHLVNWNVIVPIVREKLFGGLEVLYTSERKTLAGDKTDDFAVLNLTLMTRNVFKGLEISTSVYNVLDQKYYDPVSGEQVQDVIRQDGRSFWFKIKYGF